MGVSGPSEADKCSGFPRVPITEEGLALCLRGKRIQNPEPPDCFHLYFSERSDPLRVLCSYTVRLLAFSLPNYYPSVGISGLLLSPCFLYVNRKNRGSFASLARWLADNPARLPRHARAWRLRRQRQAATMHALIFIILVLYS